MNNTTLAQDLLSQLQGAPMQQLASQLGTTPQQTTSAVGAALPLLLGTLGRNASQPQGAQALFGALQKDHAGMDLGSVLGAVLGGAGGQQQNPIAAAGPAILGHIFGGNQPRAQQGLGQATGLDSSQATQLLAMLAPIVLSFLANRSKQQGLDAGSLGQALGQERNQIEQQGGMGGLLGAVLDQDGDGQLGIGDLMKLGGDFLGGKR